MSEVAAHLDTGALRHAVIHHTEATRHHLLDRLNDLDAYTFEQFVGRLLTQLGYHEVQVTDRTQDGGLDVIAVAGLPLLSVRIAVQVKRWKANTVKREVIDALRGSLYRVGATHGILLTTSSFSEGAQAAAGAAHTLPISLVDGDRLLDVLFDQRFSVSSEQTDLWTIDKSLFDQLSTTARGAGIGHSTAAVMGDAATAAATEFRF